MKWLFGVLLLTTLTFSAFMYFSKTGAGESKNQQAQPSLNAEKIKLLPPIVSSVSAVPSVMPSVVQSAVQPTAQVATSCMEWGDFSGNDLVHANASLMALKLGNNFTQRQVEHTIGYWVYLPPLKNSAEVQSKVAQIRALGLEEYFVIQDEGKWQNAISLGVFKTVDAAHKFRESVKAKGLQTAKAGERSSKRTFTTFVLKSLDAGIIKKLTALQEDFPESELKTAACAKSGN
jgi:hypothetical protein